MTNTTRHLRVEQEFRSLLAHAGLPDPDDVARLSRALIFLWYDTKAFVLIDLDELAPGADPLAGFDVEALRADLEDEPYPLGPFPAGFAETG